MRDVVSRSYHCGKINFSLLYLCGSIFSTVSVPEDRSQPQNCLQIAYSWVAFSVFTQTLLWTIKNFHFTYTGEISQSWCAGQMPHSRASRWHGPNARIYSRLLLNHIGRIGFTFKGLLWRSEKSYMLKKPWLANNAASLCIIMYIIAVGGEHLNVPIRDTLKS